ncbi:hypothetical protein K450DRAFT_243805 [Umbelopsis ramanniana AG]|uniref:Uncharacterized protein n=1 Tax=Umbelopsis ramanniana AG TaxID=1314678 RepID=A0AAD5EBB1_UMBRA|nr:uncharacterized protein K450DRAFT_243805 [Umbelopsis ramanniana AG]KAI8579085.1 hypothetical protein K450DRAFT_243805 [Umbelopsis ramanniana AG]
MKRNTTLSMGICDKPSSEYLCSLKRCPSVYFILCLFFFLFRSSPVHFLDIPNLHHFSDFLKNPFQVNTVGSSF